MKEFDDLPCAQQIERWQNVVRVLRALTPHQRREHWDMKLWATETPCGTVACAAGHCGLDPWFRRRGLRLDPACTMDYHLAVDSFFGWGAVHIFYNTRPRQVGQVIKEVLAYIKSLRATDSSTESPK